MSNIKTVRVEGWVPYDIAQHEEARKWLGTLNGPSFGLRIRYGKVGTGPVNENGGRMTYHHFVVEGDEAIRFTGLEAMFEAFREAGAVGMTGRAFDMEEASRGVAQYDDMRIESPESADFIEEGDPLIRLLIQKAGGPEFLPVEAYKVKSDTAGILGPKPEDIDD